MDDGCINYRVSNGKCHGFYIKISLCEDKETIQKVIEFLKKTGIFLFILFLKAEVLIHYAVVQKKELNFLK